MKTGLTLVAIAAALGAAGLLLVSGPGGAPKAYAALDLGELTPDLLAKASHRVLPEMLAEIYDAYEATEEAEIYDGLANVAAGDAIKALYLERVGEMADGGLDTADQEIHEFELLNVEAEPSRAKVVMDATWRVLGTVGHDEHMHMRGNAYSAILTLTPVAGAWKITDFSLTAVDRTDAGMTVVSDE